MSFNYWDGVIWSSGIWILICIALVLIIAPFVNDENGISSTRRMFTTGWFFPADWIAGIAVLVFGVFWSIAYKWPEFGQRMQDGAPWTPSEYVRKQQNTKIEN